MVDEGKSVSASYSHYCPVFVSNNGHALSYRFGWEWTLNALPYFTFLPNGERRSVLRHFGVALLLGHLLCIRR